MLVFYGFFQLFKIVFMHLNNDFYLLYLFIYILLLLFCCSKCHQELGFDYLRDNLAGNSGQLVMRWYFS